MKKQGFFDGIGNRILALVGVTFLIGTIGVTVFFTSEQERTILDQNERSLNILTHTVGSGLQTIMQSGSAEIAESYIDDIKEVRDISLIVTGQIPPTSKQFQYGSLRQKDQKIVQNWK
jgi:hypothetical protein